MSGEPRFAAGVSLLLWALCGAAMTVLCLLLWNGNLAVKQITQTATDMDRTAIIAGAAMTDVQKTLAIERSAAQSQIDQGAAAELAMRNSAESLNRLVRRTDRSLNDPKTGLLPALARVPATILPQAASLGRQAQANLAELQQIEVQASPAARNLATLTETINRQASPVLSHLDATTAYSESAMGHLNATSANLEATSADVRAFAHRELAPARGAWNTVKTVLRYLVEPGAAIATAAK